MDICLHSIYHNFTYNIPLKYCKLHIMSEEIYHHPRANFNTCTAKLQVPNHFCLYTVLLMCGTFTI